MAEETPTNDTGSKLTRWAMDLSLAVVALAGIATLVYEHGGFVLPVTRLSWLHTAQIAVAAFFVLDFFARMVFSGQARAYLRRGWLDLALLAMFGVGAIAGMGLVNLLQLYVGAVILLRAIGAGIRLAPAVHPLVLLTAGILLLMSAGSELLMLPAATRPIADKPFYQIDALFVALSALCGTGLPLRDVGASFTPFGQAVILALIQIGGLGAMLCGTVLALRVGRALVGQSASPARPDSIARTASGVVLVTIVVEAIGAIALYPLFADLPGTKGNPAEAAWFAVFHSVSAFCNAGFTLYRDGLMQGAGGAWPVALREHWQVLGVIAPLIVLGGLGFPVLQDCGRLLRKWGLAPSSSFEKGACPQFSLSLHTRLVLTATVTMIVLGASGLLIVERPIGANDRTEGSFAAPIQGLVSKDESDWVSLERAGRVREAFFQSVSARTGGFATIDVGRLSNGGKLWMSGLMVVGASPAGTGGGMKTVAFSIVLLSIWSLLWRRQEIEVLDRALPQDLPGKCMAMALLYLALVAGVTMALSVAMNPRESFIDVLFESCSACGNVGLSTGLTAKLTHTGKVILMTGMLLGRVGPMALLLLFSSPARPLKTPLPTEGVLI